ncbi:hypothetical protein CONLIGDRAFT_685815 [Coniochaeta ligniaria NRRL 30616]|uniref:Uncharacterized protein n=1 Tax=Coniochaeta ligniaria NRRL 30616 TaxID=1408157 RepID=A0A1J7IA47_9PEZI|nr:hypothetical protein CONLIGDRAFT_685815 [Coniochaeta ligniaria NRRL 30616]
MSGQNVRKFVEDMPPIPKQLPQQSLAHRDFAKLGALVDRLVFPGRTGTQLLKFLLHLWLLWLDKLHTPCIHTIPELRALSPRYSNGRLTEPERLFCRDITVEYRYSSSTNSPMIHPSSIYKNVDEMGASRLICQLLLRDGVWGGIYSNNADMYANTTPIHKRGSYHGWEHAAVSVF